MLIIEYLVMLVNLGTKPRTEFAGFGDSASLEGINVAREAAGQGNWEAVLATLGRWLHGDGSNPQQWSLPVQESVLALALQVLEMGDFSARWHVSKLLPALGSAAIAPLMAIVADPEADLEERWFAGRLLGEFHDSEVIAVLVQTLQSTSDAELAAITARALANQGTAAIGPLAELLNHPPSQLLAIQALAQIPDALVVPPILAVAEKGEAEARSAAILALGHFRDERIRPVLLAALTDRAATVRRAAAVGLRGWAVPAREAELLPALRPLLRDVQLSVACQAAIAIGRLKTERAAQVLAGELQDVLTPLPLQIALIRALAWMEIPLALVCLQQALPLVSTPAALEIVQVLGRVPEGPLQSQAATLLLEFWAKNARTTSSDRLPSLAQTLAHAWELLGDTRAIPALMQLQHHSHPAVACHARSALDRLGSAQRHTQNVARSRWNSQTRP